MCARFPNALALSSIRTVQKTGQIHMRRFQIIHCCTVGHNVLTLILASSLVCVLTHHLSLKRRCVWWSWLRVVFLHRVFAVVCSWICVCGRAFVDCAFVVLCLWLCACDCALLFVCWLCVSGWCCWLQANEVSKTKMEGQFQMHRFQFSQRCAVGHGLTCVEPFPPVAWCKVRPSSRLEAMLG